MKPHVVVALVSPGNVLVKGPALFVRYSGEAVPVLLDVVRLLDGTRSVDEVAVASGHPAADVRDVVDALVADRVVEDADEDPRSRPAERERGRLDPQLQLFSHLSSRPAALQAALGNARVAVLGGGALAAGVARFIEAAGAGRVETAELGDPRHVLAPALRPLIRGATHAVLALEAPYRFAFLAMNEAALAEGVPWTAVMLDGLEASVGPTVLPRQTACWRCYDLRAKGAHPNMERLLAYEAAAPEPPAPLSTPAFTGYVSALAAHALTLTLAGGIAPPLADRVVRLHMLDLRAEPHRVLRAPRCPACSSSDVPDVDRYAVDPVRLP